MSLILNIDTAIDRACISIADEDVVLDELSNTDQKDHGAFLQPAIKTLLKNTSLNIQQLDAIALSAGPGSYTGLRVGMASAKGLCYALKIPLITLSTLEIVAFSAILQSADNDLTRSYLFCPMIDARRLEVFTALYNKNLELIMAPCAMILDQNSFTNSLLKNKLLFFGNGASKWEIICKHENALFTPYLSNPLAMSKLANKKYKNSDFANLAYSEPLYLKEFFNGQAPK